MAEMGLGAGAVPSLSAPRGVLGARDPSQDRRLLIARLLAEQAQRPVGNAIGAAAQGAEKIVQALMLKRSLNEDATDRAGGNATMQNAARLMGGQPAESVTYPGQDGADPTTINWQERKPDPRMAIANLLANPQTAGVGMQQQGRLQENEDWQNRFATTDAAAVERANTAEAGAERRQAALLQNQRDLAGLNNTSEERRAAAALAQARALAESSGQRTVETSDGVFLVSRDGSMKRLGGLPPKKDVPAPKPPGTIGTGFAGGTPTDVLYDPTDKVDQQQALVDAREGAKIQGASRTAAETAIGDLAQNRQMQSANDAITPGWLATPKYWANRTLGAFGNTGAQQRATAYETLESGGAALARNQRQPGEGAVSDFDAKQFLKMVPGTSRTKEFNSRALEVRSAMDKVAQDKTDFLDAFRRQNKNLVGAEDAWLRYATANPVVNPSIDIAKPDSFLNPGRKGWQEYFGVAASAGGAPDAAPALPAGGTPAPATAAPASDPLSEARDALAHGAPRDKVLERLRQMNIDPAGL
jgi:hypothetical protein